MEDRPEEIIQRNKEMGNARVKRHRHTKTEREGLTYISLETQKERIERMKVRIKK